VPLTPKQAPELVQFGALTAEHFARWPVWIGVHTADYGEPWYDNTDEETFRPFDGELPADPGRGMLLVRAEMTLADGSTLPGFVSPPPARPRGIRDMGTMQPHLFGPGGDLHGFWTGITRSTPATRSRFYASLGREPSGVFPIRFRAETAHVRGGIEGQIDGFLSIATLGSVPVSDR
jgi:hypothetical protein